MADQVVSTKFTSDTNGFQAGITQMSKGLNQLGEKTQKINNIFGGIGGKAGQLAGAAGALLSGPIGWIGLGATVAGGLVNALIDVVKQQREAVKGAQELATKYNIAEEAAYGLQEAVKTPDNKDAEKAKENVDKFIQSFVKFKEEAQKNPLGKEASIFKELGLDALASTTNLSSLTEELFLFTRVIAELQDPKKTGILRSLYNGTYEDFKNLFDKDKLKQGGREGDQYRQDRIAGIAQSIATERQSGNGEPGLYGEGAFTAAIPTKEDFQEAERRYRAMGQTKIEIENEVKRRMLENNLAVAQDELKKEREKEKEKTQIYEEAIKKRAELQKSIETMGMKIATLVNEINNINEMEKERAKQGMSLFDSDIQQRNNANNTKALFEQLRLTAQTELTKTDITLSPLQAEAKKATTKRQEAEEKETIAKLPFEEQLSELTKKRGELAISTESMDKLSPKFIETVDKMDELDKAIEKVTDALSKQDDQIKDKLFKNRFDASTKDEQMVLLEERKRGYEDVVKENDVSFQQDQIATIDQRMKDLTNESAIDTQTLKDNPNLLPSTKKILEDAEKAREEERGKLSLRRDAFITSMAERDPEKARQAELNIIETEGQIAGIDRERDKTINDLNTKALNQANEELAKNVETKGNIGFGGGNLLGINSDNSNTLIKQSNTLLNDIKNILYDEYRKDNTQGFQLPPI